MTLVPPKHGERQLAELTGVGAGAEPGEGAKERAAAEQSVEERPRLPEEGVLLLEEDAHPVEEEPLLARVVPLGAASESLAARNEREHEPAAPSVPAEAVGFV